LFDWLALNRKFPLQPITTVIIQNKLIIGQQWKLGKTLKNGGNFWKSRDKWNFEEIADKMVLLKNVTKEKVLGIQEEEKAPNFQDRVQNDDKQIWIKGDENSKGYFTLTSRSSNMVLTATSRYGLIMVSIDGM
jgi:hypothetical protein